MEKWPQKVANATLRAMFRLFCKIWWSAYVMWAKCNVPELGFWQHTIWHDALSYFRKLLNWLRRSIVVRWDDIHVNHKIYWFSWNWTKMVLFYTKTSPKWPPKKKCVFKKASIEPTFYCGRRNVFRFTVKQVKPKIWPFLGQYLEVI